MRVAPLRTAYVFPGQGSWTREALTVWRDHPASMMVDIVGRASGIDFWSLPPKAFDRTAVVQPAILAASLATWSAMVEADTQPVAVAGHSLGEVTAAVAAGVLSPADAGRLVAERGRAFERACQTSPGGMGAVIRLDSDRVQDLVAHTHGLVVANDNAPGQVVVSGGGDALDRFEGRVSQAGGRLLRLPVAGPFHSPAMSSALVAVDVVLSRLSLDDPEVPFVSGVTGRVLETADEVRRAIVEGVIAPVRWVAAQRRLAEFGVDRIVELGPGRVLAGLARRTIPDIQVASVGSPSDVEDLLGTGVRP